MSLSDSADADSAAGIPANGEPSSQLYTTITPASAPAALFSLGLDEVTFSMQKTAAADSLLMELPIYEPPKGLPPSDLPMSETSPDADWKGAALPLSKFIHGKMVSKKNGPPRKRSRYDYEEDENDGAAYDRSSGQSISMNVEGNPKSARIRLAPENNDVALFSPENKHIRDRLHAGHQFRPPTELAMPSQSFFECRPPSQWTLAEDDELRELVKEYTYNWSLISHLLTPRTLYTSGAERRTPWECFERWISLEGLPVDLQKTHYFRLCTARMEAAARNLMAQAMPSQAAAVGTGGNVTPVRRPRNTGTIRVERRRNTKYLAMVDAMRKLAKKKEAALQKQQHGTFIPQLETQ
jgi:chromatin modification-related protein VID21